MFVSNNNNNNSQICKAPYAKLQRRDTLLRHLVNISDALFRVFLRIVFTPLLLFQLVATVCTYGALRRNASQHACPQL